MKHTIEELQFAAIVQEKAAALRMVTRNNANTPRRAAALEALPKAPAIGYTSEERQLIATREGAEAAEKLNEKDFLSQWNEANPLGAFIRPVLQDLGLIADQIAHELG